MAYGVAFATAMRLASTVIGRCISISIDVPTSNLTSLPRFSSAQPMPAAAPIPAPTRAPFSPPVANPPAVAPPKVPYTPPLAASSTLFPVSLSCWIVPSESFTDLLSAPGVFSTDPGNITVYPLGKVHQNFGSPLPVPGTLHVCDLALDIRSGGNNHMIIDDVWEYGLSVDCIPFACILGGDGLLQ